MVKWLPDQTGRFPKRPHYEPMEIDRDCETLVESFLLKKYGRIEYPISTDDLSSMIEEHVEDLDPYADLSEEGSDVEGVTRLTLGRRPVIEISETLSSSESRQNRLRTTLAHEFGHALFHDPVFQSAFGSGDLFDGNQHSLVSRRDADDVVAPTKDWMEWQAKYASAAFLMPRKAVQACMRTVWEGEGKIPPVHVDEPTARRMVQGVVDRFQVSRDTATVRLIELNIVTRQRRPPDLFG
ncbi:hypothetical protein ASG43_09215 [Aureimonas sp. Leaf454]|uniref:ImmA/IrrE family metallo-endopeptidase n=1 Tax=Aureimonas sp. Leaf454 TaxID=1736381 RepID=UPI00070133CB|nr:ImmA/IrrE family metallo-endopeptidase [Aureimonas sp. Leaf454]KQT49000.1 hypothetical protein ASG43_09215 [Aureimonas sp. Leaf454]